MNDRISKVVHKGREVVILDLSGLMPAEIVPIMLEFTEYVVEQRCTRHLVDITDTFITAEVEKAVAAARSSVSDRLGEIKSALVGARGVQMVLAGAIDKKQYLARSREDALNHLASEP